MTTQDFFAVTGPAARLTRADALKLIWRHTHRDFRGRNFATGGSDKCILILRAGGTCSVDLHALTDAEIAGKLQTCWAAEQKRLAKNPRRDTAVIAEQHARIVENIRAKADQLAELLPSACFSLETVAHLRGLERELLPLTEALRAILNGEKAGS
jgi:hypothetical protein